MPKFIIERNIPKVGHMNASEMKGACQKSNQALADLNHSAQWLHSYVTNDKLYCVYIADNETSIREHAINSGFPADRIEVVQSVIDPVSGE